jgi:hypothetical protein
VVEAYQARFAGVVGCAAHGPAFAISCGEVVASVAVELLGLRRWRDGLLCERRQGLGRGVGVPFVEEVCDVGRCFAG